MGIVVLSPFNVFPPYWGGAVRTVGILKRLASCSNSSVKFLYPSRRQVQDNTNISETKSKREVSSEENVSIWEISVNNRLEQAFSSNMLATAFKSISSDAHGIIWCEFTWSGLMGALLALITKKPIILDEHNIEHIRYKRLHSPFYPIIKLVEWFLWIIATRILVVSRADKQSIPWKMIRKKAILVPNGYDEEQFNNQPEMKTVIRKRHGIPEEKEILLFFGKLDYSPNLEALQVVKESIAPALEEEHVQIVIAGPSFPTGYNLPSNCIYVGMVDKIEDYINAADAVIVPLKAGGGTRLKIIESLACGVPVISTRIGAEGLTESNFGGFLNVVEDNNWNEFVSEIKRILKIRDYGESTDYPAGIEKYSWRAIGKQLCRIIGNIVG